MSPVHTDFEYDPEVDDERYADDDSETDDSEYTMTEDDSETFDVIGMEAEDDVEAEDDAEAEDLDESDDEAAVGASAQLRADQNRRLFAAQVTAARNRDARAAASTQRSITSQIRSIQPGGPAKVATVGAISGPGSVMATLPNGRRTPIQFSPALAPVSEVNRLRNVVFANEKRQAVAIARQSRAIRSLAAAQAGAVKRLTAHQIKSDKDIAARMVQSYNKLDKRITKELSDGTGSLGKQGKHVMRMIRQQRQRSIWNSVLLASSAPFFAAYGERGDPFAKNNLILTGSLLGFLVGDELIDAFTGRSNTALRTGANWFSYVAPIGNGALLYYLLSDKQHERFITGVNPVTAATGFSQDISDRVGEDSQADFKKGSRHVVATIVGDAAPAVAAANTVVAKVEGGLLKIDVTADATVAWMVDTYEP